MDIPAKRWHKSEAPRRILAIRLQAMGDLVITLPYLQHLRNTLPPSCRIDLLTREEVDSIPRHLDLFDHVYSIRGGRNFRKQILYTAMLVPRLAANFYEVVIDLQNNQLSRAVQFYTRPLAWSRFDRFSPLPAGERTRLTVEAAGLGPCQAVAGFRFRQQGESTKLLLEHGWREGSSLVVLNPAGAFPTRNWPIANYVAFANLWLKQRPHTQFMVLGTAAISKKAEYFKSALDDRLINLVGKTRPFEAFEIMQQVALTLTEDSGLMHMAWVSGIPTLALFGSTNATKSGPLGSKSLLLDSSDLPCGNCMREECIYHDTRCLTRYTPDRVFELAIRIANP